MRECRGAEGPPASVSSTCVCPDVVDLESTTRRSTTHQRTTREGRIHQSTARPSQTENIEVIERGLPTIQTVPMMVALTSRTRRMTVAQPPMATERPDKQVAVATIEAAVHPPASIKEVENVWFRLFRKAGEESLAGKCI